MTFIHRATADGDEKSDKKCEAGEYFHISLKGM